MYANLTNWKYKRLSQLLELPEQDLVKLYHEMSANVRQFKENETLLSDELAWQFWAVPMALKKRNIKIEQ